MSVVWQIIIAILGSGGLFSFLQFLISRKDRKILKQLEKLERDGCRTQMLVLMSDYPDEKNELMRVAEHYFHDLGGNWYMTSIFKEWLANNRIASPEWFNPAKDTNK